MEGDGGGAGRGFVRADQIDLKTLDQQLERHLSRPWTMEKKEEGDGSGNAGKTREEWEIDSSKLIIKGIIARGTFGTVHRGIYDGQDVAGESPRRSHARLFLEITSGGEMDKLFSTAFLCVSCSNLASRWVVFRFLRLILPC